MMGVGVPIVRMGWRPDGLSMSSVGAFASVIFFCTIKSRRSQAIMEEVDKGCNEFCVTVGTVTRIAGILIQLVKGTGCEYELAIWPTLVVCWLYCI